jgi:hypothetical protein
VYCVTEFYDMLLKHGDNFAFYNINIYTVDIYCISETSHVQLR